MIDASEKRNIVLIDVAEKPKIQRRFWHRRSRVIRNSCKMVINDKIGSPLIKAPGLTHFPHRMGVVAMVAVTMTSAPDAASSTVEQAFAPISLANFCALANVLLHTLTLKDV